MFSEKKEEIGKIAVDDWAMVKKEENTEIGEWVQSCQAVLHQEEKKKLWRRQSRVYV